MTGAHRIRVLVAEDNALTRLGITTLLRAHADIDVVGEAVDGSRAITMFSELQPDVLLLDLKMPAMDGIQVLRNIRQTSPHARVLVLTHHESEEQVFNAINAGARGYLTKDFEGDQIIDAIRTVHGGTRYLPPEIAARLADRMNQPSLTGRERQVLDQIFAGRSNREIAEDLSLSERTIAIYVSGILTKLDVKSRTEAVAVALDRGILSKA